MQSYPNEAAFTALYESHHAHLCTYAAHLLGFPADQTQVDDLVQETFARLWRGMHERGLLLSTHQQACAYLCRTVLNLTRDAWRRERCVPVERLPPAWGMDLADDGSRRPEPAVASCADALETLMDVQQTLTSLSPSYRATVLLAAAGYRPAEQADLLGISVPAAKMLLMRARRALRRACREEPGCWYG